MTNLRYGEVRTSQVYGERRFVVPMYHAREGVMVARLSETSAVVLDLAQWVMLDVWDVARKLSITEEDAVNAIQDSIVWIGEEMLPEDLAVEYYINRKSDFRNIIPGSYRDPVFSPEGVAVWMCTDRGQACIFTYGPAGPRLLDDDENPLVHVSQVLTYEQPRDLSRWSRIMEATVKGVWERRN